MWATAFAATTISGKTPIYRDGQDFYYETSSSAVTTAINTLFGNKHISGKYDEFITGSGAARIWSSTEKNGSFAYHTSFMNDNLYWSATEGKGDASVNSVVRAVLSF